MSSPLQVVLVCVKCERVRKAMTALTAETTLKERRQLIARSGWEYESLHINPKTGAMNGTCPQCYRKDSKYSIDREAEARAIVDAASPVKKSHKAPKEPATRNQRGDDDIYLMDYPYKD